MALQSIANAAEANKNNAHVQTNGFPNTVRTFFGTYEKGDRFTSVFSYRNGEADRAPDQKESAIHEASKSDFDALKFANKAVRDVVQMLAKEYSEYVGTKKFKVSSAQIEFEAAVKQGTLWKMLPIVFPWLGGAAIAKIGSESVIWKALVLRSQEFFSHIDPSMVKESLTVIGGSFLAVVAWLIARSPMRREKYLEKRRSEIVEKLDMFERDLKDVYVQLSELYCRYIAKNNNGFAYEGDIVLEGDERAAAKRLIADAQHKFSATIHGFTITDPFANINEWLAEQEKPTSKQSQFKSGIRNGFKEIGKVFAAIFRPKNAAEPASSEAV